MAAPDALVGRSLGEFVLRERIGEGGFGAVYRAIQPALDREAVIKLLHSRLNASAAAQERFLREAKLASKLDHPYAAHIYAFGAEPDGELWIAMELVRGTPLDQVLKLQGPLTLERFVPLLDRICEVVHTAHEQGIVHRDLKPANVMVLARAGRLLPKLLDFGIAKGLAAEPATSDTVEQRAGDTDAFAETLNTPTSGLTVRGAIMGSPPYMAPEQWLDAGTVDARTDLYALGIVAFECLTGAPPFTGKTITAIASQHASLPVPPLGAKFPRALDRVLAKVLEKDSTERYPDALAFATAFRAASGVAQEAIKLPAIARATAFVAEAPQPIAEAITAYEASRNPFQARDALFVVGRTIARYLGLLALACRSRVGGEDGGSAETLRALYRGAIADKDWVELARALTRDWIARRDAYPVPELVDALHGAAPEHLRGLLGLRDGASGSSSAVGATLEQAVGFAGKLLETLEFLREYPLVVTTAGGYAENWMGVRRTQRTTIAVRGKGLAAGAVALLDATGVPVLTLEPVFQIAAPTPGAPLELFLFEGRDARGAKLVALPASFEHHDDALWDWFRAQLAGSLDEAETRATEARAPYLGLSAFSADDRALFVGREKQVDSFVNRLRAQPLLVVVGRSGAGKSSFVHAGVVPALAWRTVAMRPGPSPLASLVARLEHANIAPAPEWTTGEQRMSGKLPVVTSLRDNLALDRDALGHLLRVDAAEHGPILLVIDQLEEMFTLCSDERERTQFAELLAGAARSADDPVRVVFTLRDDFLVRADGIAAFRNRVGPGLQILTVPASDDLLRIVVEPARRAGYELEGELAQDMVREVADQPGALALISFTASKLWELRDRHFKQLTRAAYKTLGGVGGALARHAELTLDEMLPEERALTREAFRHLVTSQNTRAVVPRKELHQLLGGDAHAESVIEKLIAARLLVASEHETGAEMIEIIHEALLVTWPRLVEWRREDSEGVVFREQLRSAAKQWDERGRAKGLLWRGDALAELARWRTRHAGPLTDLEAAFSDASQADALGARRNLRIAVVAAFIVLGGGLVALLITNANVKDQRSRAEASAAQLQANLQQRYEDQGRRFVLAGDPLRALAFFDKARTLGAGGEIHDLLVAEAIEQSSGKLFDVKQEPVALDVAFSPDASVLATAGYPHVARLWDARTGQKLIDLPHANNVYAIRFLPGGAQVVTRTSVNEAAIWDAKTGAKLHGLPDGTVDLGVDARGDVITAGDALAAWTAAGVQRWTRPLPARATALAMFGERIAVLTEREDAVVVDLEGAIVRTLHVPGATDKLALAAGRLAVVRADSALLFDDAGHQLATLSHLGDINAITSSPRGDRLCTGSFDKTAAIWDAASGKRLHSLVAHDAAVESVAWSRDGSRVVTASGDTTAALWDVASGELEARWRGHSDRLSAVAFDPTGARVATTSFDGRAIVWKVERQSRVVYLRGHTDEIVNARFSANGARAITASADGTVRIWDARTGAEQRAIAVAHASDASFSPDERWIATGTDDGALAIFDGNTGAPVRTLVPVRGAKAFVQLAWSTDGATLAIADRLGTVSAWRTGDWTQRFTTNTGKAQFSISADASTLLTVGDDLVARRWSLDGALRSTQPVPEGPVTAQLAPDGSSRILYGVHDSPTIWDAAKNATVATLVGHQSAVSDAEWSRDTRYAISASQDGSVRIWDASTGQGLISVGHPTRLYAASFSTDGRFLVAGDHGLAAIHLLPTFTGGPDALAKLIRCRVPYDADVDHERRHDTNCD